jgi:hypothetical protein
LGYVIFLVSYESFDHPLDKLKKKLTSNFPEKTFPCGSFSGRRPCGKKLLNLKSCLNFPCGVFSGPKVGACPGCLAVKRRENKLLQ